MKLYYVNIDDGIKVDEVQIKEDKNVFVGIEEIGKRKRLNKNKDIGIVLNESDKDNMGIFTYEDKLEESKKLLKTKYRELYDIKKQELSEMQYEIAKITKE